MVLQRRLRAGSSLDLEHLVEEALPNKLLEGDSDAVIEGTTHRAVPFSPPPAYSDKFGKLKKSEALEIAFKNLNRQMRSMRAYFSNELDIVASLEADEQADDQESCEFRRYVA